MSVAECCKSIVMADGPVYAGMVVGVEKGYTDSSCDELPRKGRLSIESWDKESYGEMPPYTGEGN